MKNLWGKIVKFFREVKAELKKVNWPNQKELLSYTSIVIVTVLIVTAFIGVFDLVISQLVRALIL